MSDDRHAMDEDEMPETQETQQQTQPTSQDVAEVFDEHLWGYLHPTNKHVPRLDFFVIKPVYVIGRHSSSDIQIHGMKISKLFTYISIAR